MRRGDDYDPTDVRYIFVWKTKPDAFAGLRGLKAILSLGAGVGALLKHPALPDAPIVRFVDEDLSQRMSDYTAVSVLNTDSALAMEALSLGLPESANAAMTRRAGERWRQPAGSTACPP
ncbi:MAG: hypothetical protein MO846_04965 [Candidatus Devosia symbiotica]|nr:hypothetical protein [Candidatus Devosia symbiotica]